MNIYNSCALISSSAFSMYNFRGPLIRDLVATGVTVYALAPDYDVDTRTKLIDLGAIPIDCSFSRTGINLFKDIFNMLKLVFLLRQLRPDVTLCYFIKPVIFGTLAAFFAGVPRRVAMIEGLGYVFGSSSGILSIQRILLRFLVKKLYWISFLCAHKVIFLNIDDANEFTLNRLLPASKILIVNGIGVDLFEWPLTASVSNPVTFILAARLLIEKGINEYVEAARIVKNKFPDVKFILLGGVDANPSSLREVDVKAWVFEGLLEWPGHVVVKNWLARSSVFVLPSYYREGVPRSTQEAMAMGRPVITTDMPGCRETVIDGVNGFLIPSRDVSALANAMLRFVEEPGLIHIMGIQSRRLAENRFNVDIINSRLVNLLVA